MRSRSFTAAALMRTVRCLLLVCGAVTAAPLSAQSTLPTEAAAYFNDFAHVMPAERAAGVATHLAELSKRHGREVLAVVVPSAAAYGYPDDLDRFAADLFRAWKIDARSDRRGALLVLSKAGKEAAVALGTAYPPEARNIAIDVAENVVTMPLDNDEYAIAVEFGAEIIGGRLASGDYSEPIGPPVFWMIAVPVGFVVFLFLSAAVLIVVQKRRKRREAMLAGLGGPDAEELARGFSAEEMSEDLNRQPSVSPHAPAFERPIFERPDTPSHDDHSPRTPR